MKLFEIQPESCRKPLPKKEIIWDEWYLERPELIKKIEKVLYFDPTEVYKLAAHRIDPHKRHQSLIRNELFPGEIKGVCACGCTDKPKEYSTGKFSMWASSVCSGFTADVQSIINNYFKVPQKYIDIYYGHRCGECGENPHNLQLDHTVGVKQGGGGCWLSNYKWLCHDCHVAKTNRDFGRNGKTANKNQIKMPI